MILFSWARPNTWPLDVKGYTFFARAFDALGKQLFSDDWKGVESLHFARGAQSDSGSLERFSRTRLSALERLAAGNLAAAVLMGDQSFLGIAPATWARSDAVGWLADCAVPDKIIYSNPWSSGLKYPLYVRSEELLRSTNGDPPQSEAEHASDVTESMADCKKPGTVTAMKKTIKAAEAFLKTRDHSALTKDEAEKLLEDLHSGTRSTRRKAVGEVPTGKRRTRGTLTNRDNELADCRRFLLAANWQH